MSLVDILLTRSLAGFVGVHRLEFLLQRQAEELLPNFIFRRTDLALSDDIPLRHAGVGQSLLNVRPYHGIHAVRASSGQAGSISAPRRTRPVFGKSFPWGEGCV